MTDMERNSNGVHRARYMGHMAPAVVDPDLTIVEPKVRRAVCSPAGEEIGDVRELMLDWRSGQVRYAVLSLIPSLGAGAKLFAVPWALLQIDAEHQSFVLDVAKAGANGLWSITGS